MTSKSKFSAWILFQNTFFFSQILKTSQKTRFRHAQGVILACNNLFCKENIVFYSQGCFKVYNRSQNCVKSDGGYINMNKHSGKSRSLWHFLHGHAKNIWHSYTYSYTYIKNLSSLLQTYWVYGASPIVVIPVGIQWVMWSTLCQISLHGTHLAQQCHKIYVMHTYFISATNLHDTLTYSNITKCV